MTKLLIKKIIREVVPMAGGALGLYLATNFLSVYNAICSVTQ